MANFNYLDFIKIPNSTDTKLYIKDINGNIIWTISPFKVESTLIQNNNIKINFYNTDSVLINFNTISESKIAIVTLERYLTQLRNKIPTQIDKATQLYIDNAVTAGLQGPTGSIGPQGIEGPIGLQGATGPFGGGPQGPIGTQGYQGPQGYQGNYGPVLPAGLTWEGIWISGASYNINDTVSYASASWFCFNPTSSTLSPDLDSSDWALLALQGSQGNQGNQGNQGEIGQQGTQGITGPQGVTGPQGFQGDIGAQGYTGSQGVTGSQGNQGVTGPQGNQGATGPQGYTGLQGPQGYQGPISPSGLIWMGLWVSGLSYSINDSVSYASSSWFCFNPTASTLSPDLDSSDWALLSSQGAPGNQGTQGITGPQGIIGPQGYQGEQGNKSGIQYYFDSNIIGGISFNGSLRFDNSIISNVENFYINKLDNNGVDFSEFISLWTNSISSVKGFLSVKENNNSNSIYSVFAVMDNVIDNITYFTVPVMYISGNIPINGDILAIDFLRSGRDGTQGPIGPQGYQAIFGQIGLISGTISVSDTNIQSTSIILLTPIGSGTGSLWVTNYTNSGFLISSSSIDDTRTINYLIHY